MAAIKRQNYRPGDIVKVDGKKATVVSLVFSEAVGLCAVDAAVWTDGASVIENNVALHRVTPA